MKAIALAVAGTFVATMALAQTAPPPPAPPGNQPPTAGREGPPPSPDTERARGHRPDGSRHGGPRHGHQRGDKMGRDHARPMPPLSKAAHFRFEKGDSEVEVKCPDDEPVKACVEATLQLLDKLGPR